MRPSPRAAPRGRSPACRWPTRTCSTARARSPAGAPRSAPTSRPPRTPPPSPASRRPAPCRSPPCIWPSSPTARPGTTTCSATPAIPGTRPASPAARRPARASSVAYGAIPVGLGSDTGGSLRLPAACCGVASIKPTWGRISRAGAMPLAPALDTVGVIARHVEDLALTLGVLAGPDARDPAASTLPVPDYVARLDDPVKGLKVGVDETVDRRGASRGAAHGRGCAGGAGQARPASAPPAASPTGRRSTTWCSSCSCPTRRRPTPPSCARGPATTARRCARASRSATSSAPSTT